LFAVSRIRHQCAAAASGVDAKGGMSSGDIGRERFVGGERGGAGCKEGRRGGREQGGRATVFGRRASGKELSEWPGFCSLLQQQRRSVPAQSVTIVHCLWHCNREAAHVLASSLWLRCASMLDLRCFKMLQFINAQMQGAAPGDWTRF
jgi:hypothetical protein